ncbi:aspartyl-phosphate phosphatase Spo0E family protein [Natranaerobius thermophilus]|uniref:Sporulation stage 0, Spo0E-like regulatory phosphatase n=1 Tax=Natranaerobius thermophilus (strain ATCC BAA-1301 / DSM 18059 / JW/NM-WN-LF) TaxID=457570 RepID=B2A750_NATTJ|nr:aspartyl-phosphate phosphatase Spo0E family protein [Natranaerobius thermophilus]ACB85641.1 conserved hypothetical protein [Natranaerobius thermophilus JW/NM-WN-LF]
MDKRTLLYRIEELREELERVTNQKQTLRDPNVIELSQKLDELLVAYNRKVEKERQNGKDLEKDQEV